MSEYEIQVGSLEELALKRRERLKNLKRKAQADTATPIEHQPDEPTKVQLPRATQLLESQEAENGAGDDTAMEVVEVQDNDVVTTMTKEIDVMKKPLIIEEIDIQNLAPRKPDWDLKRDVAKKLEILDRRTQRAIAEIIRDRLRSNQGDVNLEAVNTVGYSTQA